MNVSRAGAADILLACGLALLSALAPAVALRTAAPQRLDLGPNDADSLRGFREDWERDGEVRFRWTTLQSTIRLPLGLRGAGAVLELRYRRHFDDPALIRITTGGVLVGSFEAKADRSVPYQQVSFALPANRDPLEIGIESTSANRRPLGIALDWLEVRPGPGGFSSPLPLSLWTVAAVVSLFAGLRLAGAPPIWATGLGLLLLGTGFGGLLHAPLPTHRITSQGGPFFVAFLALLLSALRLPSFGRFLRLRPEDRPWLFGLAALALAVRLALLLDPRFYYPDVRIHGQFAWQLARLGLERFLEGFTASQFRYSLGLQFVNGHWYAFPYPPLFYLSTWPLTGLLGCRPELAVSALAAVANSFEVLAIYALGRRLLPGAGGLLAAGAAPLLSIFVVRLSLGYFPALFGHAVDAWLMLVLVDLFTELPDRKRTLTAAVLLAVSLLAYTQGVLNFGILLPLILGLEWASDSSPLGRSRQRTWLLVGLLGVGLATVSFYGRYVPMLADMARGIPQPEERIVLELQELRARNAADDPVEEEADDPFARPDFEALRGLRKALSRLWIFFGAGAGLIGLGLLRLALDLRSPLRRLVLCWANLYLILNFASGSLPGPNLFRYNKDLESVAPLLAVAVSAWAVSDSVSVWWRRLGQAAWAAFLLGSAYRVAEVFSRHLSD